MTTQKMSMVAAAVLLGALGLWGLGFEGKRSGEAQAIAFDGEKYTFPRGSFMLKAPKEWQTVLAYRGVPLGVYGPMKDGVRPLLMVTPTGYDFQEWKSDEFAATEREYQELRREWAEDLGYEIKDFKKHETRTWPGITKAEHFGLTFYDPTENETYTENSYYVFCGRSLYHLKSMLPAKVAREGKALDQTVETFQCTPEGSGV
jgi:hypothetical protein